MTSPGSLIADANLEGAISDEFYIYDRPIFISDLETLISLEAPAENISSLSGLEYCFKLEILEVQNNNIRDLSPIKELPNLKMLVLSSNNISDITPLVDNNGLGIGDEVYLVNNSLDLADNSEDMLNIRELEDRGVIIYY
jgi:Leucine-rich repeat (LRR) protein